MPLPLTGFALSMRRMAHQNLDSLIRVMSFHSGDQFGTPGESAPLLLLLVDHDFPARS